MDNQEHAMNIAALSEMFSRAEAENVALKLNMDEFAYVYRYIMHYVVLNRKSACKVLFTIKPLTVNDEKQIEGFEDFVAAFFRKSDILTRSGNDQCFLLLTDVKEASVIRQLESVVNKWHEVHGNEAVMSYEYEYIAGEDNAVDSVKDKKIVVVDDDGAILQLAGRTLSKAGYYVAALRSGQALLKHLEENVPDLILLDVKMEGMDGFETLEKLRSMERVVADIPVVFLTADESIEAEKKGLSLGAIDFIKKPFVPEVLVLRIKNILELETLKKYLSSMVDIKTEENQKLLMHVVRSLAEAIDAKDTYTNGHSGRVAQYSRMIAKRAGYSAQDENDIYMMGLLHDVGKIGIPDAVINKPARLTDEEYEVIKTHPVMGSRILKNIKEMPKLSTGARWHHERYDGSGYPDNLKGEDIPEEARIIAVADAYDAMTSRRSYRDSLPQETVRSEIEKGRGTQFDPRFADIMLEMIDEDTEYTMKES